MSKKIAVFINKYGKRAISLLLCIVLSFEMLNLSQLIAFAIEEATEANIAEDTVQQSTEIATDTATEATVDVNNVVVEDLTVSSNYTLTADIEVNNLYVTGGELNLNGYQINVQGNVEIRGGVLRLNRGYLICNGNFTVRSNNYIYMQNVNDQITVYGDFVWDSARSNYITNGLIKIGGSFCDNSTSSTYAFSPSEGNKVLLNGRAKQIVVQASLYSEFNELELDNNSEEGVCFNTPVNAKKLIQNNTKITSINGGKVGWTLTQDEEYNGDLTLVCGTLDLNGHTLTVNGSLYQLSGIIDVNNGNLIVKNNYHIQSYSYDDNNEKSFSYSTGYLKMTNAEDTVTINGDFITGSTNDHTNYLTNGTMYIKGDFTQLKTNSYNNFKATENHKVVFNGEKSQKINFEYSGSSYSCFAKLEFANSSENGITVSDNTTVTTEITNESSKVNGSINPGSNASFTNNKYIGNVKFSNSYTLNDNLTIDGDVSIYSVLYLNTYTLIIMGDTSICSSYVYLQKGELYCNKNLTTTYTSSKNTTSTLVMQNNEDYVQVKGNYTHNSYTNGYMKAGVVELKGDFEQKSVGSGNNFIASGTNVFLFSGNKKQTIKMASPLSNFNAVKVTNNSNDGVVVDGYFNCLHLECNDGKICLVTGESIGTTLTEDTVYNESFYLGAGELNLNGHTLTINGDLIQSGGTVNINGGKLIIDGDYRIQTEKTNENTEKTYSASAGYLKMTNAEDTVTINGDFITGSTNDHTNYLTNGTMYIKGDFTQLKTNSYNNFKATENHKVVFNGEEAQKINFEYSGSSYSCFAKLEFANSSENGITVSDNTTVTTEITNESSKVNGSINPGSNASFTNNKYIGDVKFSNSYTLNDNLTIDGDVSIYSVLYLNTYTLIIMGDTSICSSYVYLQKGELYCNKNLTTTYTSSKNTTSTLVMQNNEDYVQVKGNYTHNSYTNGYMKAGVVELKGDFEQKSVGSGNNFIASGSNVFLFSGDKKQTIAFATTTSYFNIVEINNKSQEGIYCTNGLNANEIITNGCNIEYAGSSRIGWKLTSDVVIGDDLILIGDTLDLNGYTLTIAGDFIHQAGTVNINGGALIVEGDYHIESRNYDTSGNPVYGYSSGILQMVNSNDYVQVNGDFITSSSKSHKGLLTSGVFELKGDLTQKYTSVSDNFLCADDMVIKLSGDDKQTIKYGSSSSSRIANIVINNSSKDGVVISSGIYVDEEIDDISKNISGMIYVSLLDNIKNNECSGDICAYSQQTLSADLTLSGTLVISGKVSLNGFTVNAENIQVNDYGELIVDGGRINCNKDFTINSYGRFYMNNATDSVVVGGNFITNSVYSHNGLLTEGLLEIKGDFTQNGTSTSFIATGNHTVLLSGKTFTSGRVYKQSITFLSAGNSYFNKLIVTKPISYYNFNVDYTTICKEYVEDFVDIEPPTKVTDLTVVTAETTKVTLTWTKAVDDIDVVGYEIYRNNKKIGTITQTEFTDNSVQPEESYTYKVCAFDAARNYSEFSSAISVTTLKDTEAPDVPQSVKIKSRTGSSITIGWLPSTDNVECTGYKIYRNSEEIAIVENVTEYKDANLEQGVEYTYKIKAFDKAGNESEVSSTISGYVMMPKITNITPADYCVLGLDSVQIKVVFLNSGNSVGNKVKLQYSSDNVNWNDVSKNYIGQQNYTGTELCAVCDWDISKLASGDYTLKCTLYDVDNNYTEKEVTYTIDNTPPQPISNVKATTKNGVITVSWGQATDADCTSYKLYRKSGLDSNFSEVTHIKNVDTVAFTDKDVTVCESYQYYVTALDKFSHESAQSNIVEILNSSDEEIPYVTKIADSTRIAGKAKIKVTAYDNIQVSRILLQYKSGDEWIDIGEETANAGVAFIQWDTSSLADGKYTVRAIAYDTSNNASGADFTANLTVDNTGPYKIVITETSSTSTSVSIKWQEPKDNDFSFCKIEQLIDGEFVSIGNEAKVLGRNITGLKPNTTYQFKIIGYDDMGNRGVESDVLEITTSDDMVKPCITSILPAQSSYNQKIDISVTAKDNFAVKSMKLYYSYDKENWSPVTSQECTGLDKEYTFKYSCDLSSYEEGIIYFKAMVTDSAENEGEEVVVSYNIDRTVPNPIADLKAVDHNGYVSLTWTTEDTDVKSFRIYRADEETGVYTQIVKECTTKNYYDQSIEYGKIYLYKIEAVDVAGNVGEESNEALVQTSEDTQKPIIYGITSDNSETLCSNPTINVVAYDAKLSSVYLEYKKADSGDVWNEIGSVSSIKSSYEKVKFTWNTNGLEDGEYIIRAVATDYNNNVSEPYKVRYILDTVAPADTVLKISPGNYQLDISWSEIECDDFAYYKLYRKSEVENDYTEVLKTTSTSYTDTQVIAGVNYKYKVKTYDVYGNYSESNIVSGYAYDIDTVAPKAIVADEMIVVAGKEFILDGTESTDNVRIKSFAWDMGNNEQVSGARATYTYKDTGTYTATLTVTDSSDNSNTTEFTITVLDPKTSGSKVVQAVDESNHPLAYAYVYLYNGDEGNRTLRTDSNGMVTISGEFGEQKIAIYKQGYLPTEKIINIDSVANDDIESVVLKEGEVVVGDFSVHRMELEEMVEAGIDFTNPANYDSFTFTVELKFQQQPIPTVIQYIYTGDGSTYIGGGGSGGSIGGGGGTGGSGGGNSSVYHYDGGSVQIEKIETPEEAPIFAYINKTDSISWLKEMFCAELGIMNCADAGFSLVNCMASIELPNGVSLADTINVQSLTQSMGTIEGQSSSSVSWYIRGDKAGEYNLSANFSGTLMPFGAPINATFKTKEPFTVELGKGIHIYIYPESAGYIGKTYYIQYEVRNQSSRNFYNLTTTFGTYTSPGYEEEIRIKDPETGEITTKKYAGETYVIPEASQCKKVPVLSGGDSVSVGVLAPGESIYGTYSTTFTASGDADKVYYELIEYVAKELGQSNTGVELHISPIPSHITKYNLEYRVVSNLWGDPVNMTTGAFTDTINAMTVNSNPLINFELSYNSLSTALSECGYGWYHNYESKLVNDKGVLNLYLTPESYISFVSADQISRTVNGVYDNTVIRINTAEEPTGAKTYECITTGMSDYKLSRDENGKYTLIAPDGSIWNFNSEGKMTKMTQTSGKSVDITYGQNSMTITEPQSGMYITAHYSDNGLLTSVEDNTGRTTTFAYTDGLLTKATNALGESVYYTYDENKRIVREENNNGVEFVVNTYDELGRVITQDDALASTPLTTYSYQVDDYGKTVATATDRNGNTVKYYSDGLGHITKIEDQNGNAKTYAYDSKGNNIAEYDGEGNVTMYFYDEKGNVTKMTNPNGDSTFIEYDSNNNATKVTGTDSKVNTYTYNNKNQLVTSTDNAGVTKTYTYDDNGNLLSEATSGLGTIYYGYTNGLQTTVTDYYGNVTTTAYDAVGNISSVQTADGTTAYTYDALGRVKTITTPNGGTLSYTYDCSGNKTSVTQENGATAYFEYNGNNWLTKETDTLGNVTTYQYDNEGRATKRTNPDGSVITTVFDGVGCATSTTDEEGNVYTYAYDKAGRLISEISPNDAETTHEYYPDGKEKKTTYADASYITYTYTPSGEVKKTEDNLGNVYKYEYDNMGNLIKITDPLENITTNEYDKYSRLLSTTDANGNKTSYEYDLKGNCIQKTNADGLVVDMTYDAMNRLTTATAKTEYGDYTISYQYDALGRVSSYTDEEGNTFTTEYDHLGNVTAVKDAYGNVTTSTQYNSAGNTTKVTDALGVSNNYTYDVMGNLTKSVEYANTSAEAVSTYSYDALGRLLKAVDAENGESSYTYDSIGNITSVTDPNGGVSTYTYDLMGRMTSSTNAIGSTSTYTYNSAGLLEKAIDAKNQTTTYTYDALGRITTATDGLGKIEYTYDANGNILTVTDENGTITREYDEMNRVTKYTDFRGNTVEYSYDTLGNLIALTYPGGKIVRYSYYPTGRLKTVTDWNDRVTSYEYNKNGLLTKLSRPDGSVETYEYDANSQLIKQTDMNGETVVNSFTYTYDTAGNISNIKSENVAQGTVNVTSAEMEYDSANRLIKYNGQEVKYDSNGNMTYGPLNGEMATFTYDCRNRLISAGNTSYEYDAENNRIAVITDSVRTDYVVENNSGDLSQTLSATTNGKTTLYVYGNGLLAQEDEEKGYLTYHFNNIGSTTAITDESGKIIHAYTYGAYGELLTGETDGILFLYNGKYGVITDSNGLYYMRARYYNPEIKRFINQDVIEGNITNSTSLNKYAYCQGNPIKLTDPFGLSPQMGWSMLGHALLDVLGFVPVIGAVADVINAVWYLAEGDYFSAAASFVSAIPGFGDIAGGIAKGVTGCAKLSKGIKYASKIAGGIGNLSLGAYQLSNTAVGLYDKHITKGQAWDLDSTLQLGSAMIFAGTSAISAKGLANDLANFDAVKYDIVTTQCFVAGTLVLTIDGNRPIEDIKAGDLVYSTNPETGESEYKEVLRTFRKEADVIIHIFVNGEEIETTPTHPFWVEDKWVSAKDLRAGDILTLADGSNATITKVYGEKLDEAVIVYNFEVEDFHTYFITSSEILVHNASCGKAAAFSDLPWYEQPRNTTGRGRAKNNIVPNKKANGKHVVYKADQETGKVTNYKVYDVNPKNPNGFDEILGYDAVGKPHINKVTNEALLPHMHDPKTPGGVRIPYLDEIPD